jgi:DNA-binding response OmpR family regulator
VVFVTARSDETELEMLRQLGVAEVIRKPFGIQELVDQVKAIWSSLRPEG